MRSKLFRQSAIDQMSSPNRLDETLAVTKPRDWLFLLGMGLMLLAAAVWAERGSIASRVNGEGVVILAQGVVNAYSEAPGRVIDIRVRPGDRVVAGQVVGSISQQSLREKIRTIHASIAEMERERDRSSSARAEGLRLQAAAMENQRANLERDIAGARSQVGVIAEQVRVEEELLVKGLITRQQVLTTRQRGVAAENQIANFQAQIKQLESTRFQGESQVSTADRESAARISEARRNVRLLENELTSASTVRSPYSGKVIELKVYPGSLINTGDPFLSIEPGADRLELIVFVPAAGVKEVQPGMAAEIVPASVKREEFGYLKGQVVSVAEFPATRAAVMRSLENESLASALAGRGPVHELRVSLQSDGSTPSGFRWSTPQGPPIRLSSGTLCTVSIVTREQRPIDLVLPFLDRRLRP